MHLRSEKSIASGLSTPLRVLTQGSGMGPSACLPPIIEYSHSRETESTTSTSLSMASHLNDGGGEEMQNVHFDVPLFNKRLIFMLNKKKMGTFICRPIQSNCC